MIDIQKLIYLDENDNVTTGIQAIDDLVYDIALGITGNQSLGYGANGDMLKDKSKKIQKLKPKTNLHNIIEDALEKSQYRRAYEWDNERIFKTKDGEQVELIKYDITTGEYCIVKIDGKEMKMTKKWFREWWESRE